MTYSQLSPPALICTITQHRTNSQLCSCWQSLWWFSISLHLQNMYPKKTDNAVGSAFLLVPLQEVGAMPVSSARAEIQRQTWMRLVPHFHGPQFLAVLSSLLPPSPPSLALIFPPRDRVTELFPKGSNNCIFQKESIPFLRENVQLMAAPVHLQVNRRWYFSNMLPLKNKYLRGKFRRVFE